jgi:HEPN domain-containing protein
MNRGDFKALAVIRLREANLLLKNKHYSGAYYLAGYAIECALKACISKETRRYDFPDKQRALDSWIHSLTNLLRTAGLQASLDAEISADPQFAANWNVVKDWSEQSRYSQTDQKEAEALIRATSDKGHGVLRWLKQHW